MVCQGLMTLESNNANVAGEYIQIPRIQFTAWIDNLRGALGR
jgi:hypothetical protein